MVSRQSAALSSTTEHAMPPELDGKCGTECLNTRFPLPTLLCAVYSVKLIKKNKANKFICFNALVSGTTYWLELKKYVCIV